MKAYQSFVLVAAAALLTACASQQPAEEGVAPSQQALEQEEVSGAPQEAPEPGDMQGEETAMAPETGGEGDQRTAMAPETEPFAGEPDEKPIVPAFPSRVQEGRLAELETVHFPFDSSELTDSARRALQRNADWLRANTGVAVRIEGHCDERGSNEYNLALGQRRANSVREFLVRAGIDPQRLRTVSYGEEVPLVRGHTESAYRRNRRAEFAAPDA